jgi:DNA ligase-1
MSLTLGPIFNQQGTKVRQWSIIINLFDSNNNQIDINDETQEVPKDAYTTYHTSNGYIGMTITKSEDTIVKVGKNIGRKNETNVLQQAVKNARSKYNLKMNSGYSLELKENTKKVPFPMAVKPWKNESKKLVYPLYVQPKLDGIRMIAILVDNEVQIYSRRLHDVPGFDSLKSELYTQFMSLDEADRSVIIDGELYAHGMHLNEISGIVRNESTDEINKCKLQYHIFDCFDTSRPNLTFEDRYKIIEKFCENKGKYTVLTKTKKVNNAEAADDFYFKVIGKGYEGIIYKMANKPYEYSFDREKRSSMYQKRKKQDDAEFEIVDFTSGKGKDADAIVFILKVKDGLTFNCVPNGTYTYRKELYKKATEDFNNTFKGKLAKVIYDDISSDGVPLRGRIVQIDRDISFD